MKKINLTVGERVGISNLFNAIYQQGGLSLQMLTLAQKLIDKIAIDEAEKKKVSWKSDLVNNIITWKAADDKGKELELTSDEVKFLEESLNSKNKEKKFSLGDGYIVKLVEKLDIKLDDSSK